MAATIDYIASGYDPIEMSQSHRKADSDLFASAGLRLINKSDCRSCHINNVRSVGPSYQEVALKYTCFKWVSICLIQLDDQMDNLLNQLTLYT